LLLDADVDITWPYCTVLEDVMIDAIKMTQQLVALELVDEGVTAKHILDRLVKRRRVETLRMSAFKSVRVILVY